MMVPTILVIGVLFAIAMVFIIVSWVRAEPSGMIGRGATVAVLGIILWNTIGLLILRVIQR